MTALLQVSNVAKNFSGLRAVAGANYRHEQNYLDTYAFALTVQDEAGCQQPSHGLLYAVEKHGYTAPVEIPWPAP